MHEWPNDPTIRAMSSMVIEPLGGPAFQGFGPKRVRS